MRIEWHPEAINDLKQLGEPVRRRIKKVLAELQAVDDPRKKLSPYSGNMKGFWKLRTGDYRLVCQIFETDKGLVLIVAVAHRSVAYDRRHAASLENRRK